MADDERPVRRFEYQTDEVPMTEVDRRVLAALPTLMTRRQWPAVIEICELTHDVHPNDVRSCLARLQDRYLVDGGGDSQTFARTPRGTFALELGVDRPSDYTRFGPSDKAGQPCMGQCGRRAPRPGPGPGEADGQGWRYNDGEDRFAWAFLCPDCKTKPDLVDRLRACMFPSDQGWREDLKT
jgi:hypothetical protein